MAHHNYARPGGVWAALSPLASNECHLFDVAIFKSVNGDDGGVYSPTSPLVFGGLGVNVTGQFFASNADITVPSGKSLQITGTGTLTTAGTSVVNFGATVNFLGSSTTHVKPNAAVHFDSTAQLLLDLGSIATVSGTLQVASTGALNTINGSTQNINSAVTIGPLGTITLGASSLLTAANNSTITCAGTSTVNLGGATHITSTGTMTCDASGNFVNLGTCAFNAAQTFGSSSTTTFASGAVLTLHNNVTTDGSFLISAPGSMTLASGALLTLTGNTTRIGKITRSGNGAYENVRLVLGTDFDTTFDARQFDVLRVPITSAGRAYTLADLGTTDYVRVTIERFKWGSSANAFYVKDAGGVTIATYAGPGGASAEFLWDGGAWYKLMATSQVT